MSQAQDRAYQPQSEVIEHPARVGNGFDLRTHIKDGKTGELLRVQPYRRFCVGLSVYYERPKLSGNLFYEDGKPAGRRIEKEGKWVIDDTLPHVDFIAPKTHLTRLEDIQDENETLRAELAALKAEKEVKLETKPAQVEQKPAQAAQKK